MINKKGSALILSFWVMIILIVMGYSISRRVNAEISLARYQLSKTRAKYAAFGGLFYVIDQIREDLNDQDKAKADTLFDCGTVLSSGQMPEDIFSEVDLSGATFSVKRATDSEDFGLADESGKININALTVTNYQALKELLVVNDVQEQTAEMIASAVIDWKDADSAQFKQDFGAEQSYYKGLSTPYDCKNGYFETLDELMLVRGMTPQIFKRIAPDLTVYPFSGNLQINFNTASQKVLLALARSVMGAKTNTDIGDARGFVEKVLEMRVGSDGVWGTKDDDVVDFSRMLLGSSQRVIASMLSDTYSPRARVIRAYIQGQDSVTGVKTWIDAVIKTDALEVVSLKIQ